MVTFDPGERRVVYDLSHLVLDWGGLKRKMQRRHSPIITLVAAQLAIWPATCSAWAAQTEVKAGHASINLELGIGTTLNVARPFSFALIGDPRVIDFQVQGDRSLLLRPVGIGTSNLVIVDKKGIVITNVTIVVRSIGAI